LGKINNKKGKSIIRKMFVSRAGEKLEYAIEQFDISIKDKICADFGCSTGGFTDCMLNNGASVVYAVDTGYGVLDWKLRNDARVKVFERNNAIFVDLPEKADFIAIDVGWTRQKDILSNAFKNLKDEGIVVSLIKPQYEASKSMLTAGKLEEKFLNEVLQKTLNEIKALGITVAKFVESPIEGEKAGNKEFLAYLIKEK